MRELDRQRDYAEVQGLADHSYEQDGLRFDIHGNVHPDDKKLVKKHPPILPEPTEDELAVPIQIGRDESVLDIDADLEKRDVNDEETSDERQTYKEVPDWPPKVP